MAEDKKAMNVKKLPSLNVNTGVQTPKAGVQIPSNWKNDEQFYRRLERDKMKGPPMERLARLFGRKIAEKSPEGRKLINKLMYGDNAIDPQKPLNIKKLGSLNTRTMKKGGKVKAKKPRDGRIKKAKSRDGIAQRGKTRGRMR